jgi:hypothetical protein
VADVIAAVRFGREHALRPSVRGGGHAVAGHALCNDGLVIDLSTMTGSRVDPLARTIQVQGGCLNAHLTARARPSTRGHGRIVSHTGIAGLTLGGGSVTSCANSIGDRRTLVRRRHCRWRIRGRERPGERRLFWASRRRRQPASSRTSRSSSIRWARRARRDGGADG